MNRLKIMVLVLIVIVILPGCLFSNKSPNPSVYTASGNITYCNEGLASITVAFSTGGTAITDGSGNWSKPGLTGVVTVIPQSEEFQFEPSQAQVSSENPHVNFVATLISPPEDYIASGSVTYSGQGLADITIYIGEETISTDESGNWSMSGLTGVVTVIPQSEEYQFEPSQAVVSSGNPHMNFIAILKNPPGPAPKVPAIDYVVTLVNQPFSQDSNVIWYDSFDLPNIGARYMEYVYPERFYLSTEEALGGRGMSIKGVFDVGTVSAGSIKAGFGDWPAGYRDKVVNPNERYDCIYWRIYVKHEEGWRGNPYKMSRATSVANGNWAQAMVAHVWGGQGNSLTLDPVSGIDINTNQLKTTKYNDFENFRWLGNKPEATFPIFATEESGKWVAVEASVKLNTPGLNDGWFYLWIDGQLEATRENLSWTGTWNERGINAVFLENYWNDGSPYRQVRYFDDFVISTEYIGLARTPLNPEIVKTPFRSTAPGRTQGAWQVQVSSEFSEASIVWDSGIIYGDGNRVTVDTQNGTFMGDLAGQTSLESDVMYAARVRHRDNTGAWSAWSNWRYVIQTL